MSARRSIVRRIALHLFRRHIDDEVEWRTAARAQEVTERAYGIADRARDEAARASAEADYQKAEAGRLREWADAVAGYTLHLEDWGPDDPPRIILNCPHEYCPGDVDDGGCAANLLAGEDLPVTLGRLLELAAAHEALRAGWVGAS